MRSVLMFCEKFPPYNVSGTARPYYFAKYLPEFDYAPTVVSSELPEGATPDWTMLQQLPPQVACHWAAPLLQFTDEAFAARRSKSLAERAATAAGSGKDVAAQRASFRSWVDEARWAMQYLVNWNIPAGLTAARFVTDVDLIWATAPHFRNLVPAYLLSLMSHKPLVIDLRDPWTYGSLWSPTSPRVERWERGLAVCILNHAQRIVLTSPLTTLEMQRRFPGPAAERMVTITNGYAEIEVEPERGHGSDKFLLRYIGMLNQRRTPDVLLQGLRLALENPGLAHDLRFEFIGSMGGHGSKLLDPGLRGVVKALGSVPHERSLALIKGSDVNVLLQTIDEGQDVIAGKTFEYLAAGQPILAVVDEGGGDAWLLRDAKAGTIVGWRDPNAIAAALIKAWELWKTGQRSSQVASLDIKRYTRKALTGRLAEVFNQVVTGD